MLCIGACCCHANTRIYYKLVALGIDEAHCVKTWREEFRVAFAQIGELQSLLPPGVNINAFTATATSTTYEIVKSKLCLKNLTLAAVTPNRDNRSYQVNAKISPDMFTSSMCSELIAKRQFFPSCVCKDLCRLYNSIHADQTKAWWSFDRASGLSEYSRSQTS